MKKMFLKQIPNKERGDTIVEVLVCVAVLGLVFGAAYVSSNQNIMAGRATQERLEAVKLAEAQFERLRVAVSQDENIFNRPTSFCIPQTDDPSSALVNASDAKCAVSANGDPAGSTVAPRYRVSVRKSSDLSSPSLGIDGARFEVSVAWEAVRGDGDDLLNMYYELYQ